MSHPSSGPITWMARHKVAANLLMIMMLLGGAFFTYTIKKEVFPSTEVDTVSISVSYSGATPEEVEKGIVLAVEEEIRDIEGIKEISSNASEGGASISAELESGADRMLIYQEIQQRVDAITTFPDEAERPRYSMSDRKRHVVTMMLYGGDNEWNLREYAERLRDRLLSHKTINQVELEGTREYEIRVEISKEMLERYGLTLREVSSIISKQALELSGGSIKSSGGKILIRLDERRDFAKEYAGIPIVVDDSGQTVYLRDIAKIEDTFEESDYLLTFNGQRSVTIDVYRTGDETPIGVSQATKEVLAAFETELPPGMKVEIRHDRSDIYQQRLELLLKNGFIGLLLVMALLGAFLEFRLAFWVAVGIPTSFLGAFLFLPWMGVSINMISMFAFIVALGIVVDDAIIAGENIYEYQQRGMRYMDAAIMGAKDIAVPLSFAIITNIVAFLPLAFVPGMMGKLFMVIPLVVGTVFALSWIEALFILPHHLAFAEKTHRHPIAHFLYENQQKIARSLNTFIDKVYQPVLKFSLAYRYATVGLGIAILLVVISYVQSGRLGFEMMPRIESDRAVGYAILPVGSTMEEAKKVEEKIVKAGLKAVESAESDILKGYRSRINENEVRVDFYLLESELRPITTAEFNRRWRQFCGSVPGVDTLKFRSDIGGPGGGQASISIELSHRDSEVLQRASSALAERISEISGTKDVEDGFSQGKRQVVLTLTPYGEALNLNAADLSSQIRASFNGVESIRQLRGRNEVKVKLYLPESERKELSDLSQMKVKLPSGELVPLSLVADFSNSRSNTTITRRDGKRTVQVEANVLSPKQLTQVTETINTEIIPELLSDFPGLQAGYRGRQADMQESMQQLIQSFLLVLVVIYITLALPFQSYTQPIMVMVAIPFGIVGAFLGHYIMGFALSVNSVMGIVALSGVVINDTLVLIDYANRKRREGALAYEAIVLAGTRRFRPIMLTTVTTFGGLAPMIFETSIQAKFLIPMALSLGYGILFATFISLVLVPSLYLILEDVQGRFKKSGEPVAQTSSPEMEVSTPSP